MICVLMVSVTEKAACYSSKGKVLHFFRVHGYIEDGDHEEQVEVPETWFEEITALWNEGFDAMMMKLKYFISFRVIVRHTAYGDITGANVGTTGAIGGTTGAISGTTVAIGDTTGAIGGTTGAIGGTTGAIGGTTGAIGSTTGAISGTTGAIGGTTGAIEDTTGAIGGTTGAIGGTTGAIGGTTGAIGGTTGAIGSTTGAIVGTTGAIGGTTGAIGATTGTIGGTTGAIGGTTGAIGSTTGAIVGTTGAIGGTTGAIGATTGTIGGTTGAIGSTTGAIGGTTGAIGGTTGAIGGTTGTIGATCTTGAIGGSITTTEGSILATTEFGGSPARLGTDDVITTGRGTNAGGRTQQLAFILYDATLSHMDCIAYSLVVLNVLQNGSVLSLVYVALMFLWGLGPWTNPSWKSRTFWIVMMLYTMVVISVKYIILFWTSDTYWIKIGLNPKDGLYLPLILFGIRYDYSPLYDIVWDMLLLVAIIIHQTYLKVSVVTVCVRVCVCACMCVCVCTCVCVCVIYIQVYLPCVNPVSRTADYGHTIRPQFPLQRICKSPLHRLAFML